jgi:hypothetical protein
MKKIFQNVNGNQFKLITESVTEVISGSELVREGLKKVFTSGHNEISYKKLQNVGRGYIKSISQADKCALQEAQNLASQFGYENDECNQKFVKTEVSNPEYNTSNPEESRELQIGNKIIDLLQGVMDSGDDIGDNVQQVLELANELVSLHSKK